ncbi:hypothetical protein F2Q69_00005037 [Brassica cretica]|uniref:Uncharacterized protein n=1 Tax=Brassica cretica TaxID=69181 RepID=A0A8S9PKA4_BRACR|nr:hypothetical protein F2Q69_00005037 [Brassica cretica]
MLFLSEGSTHADLVAMAQDDLLVNRPDDLLMMHQLHTVYGEWFLKDRCWNFVVDHFKGARMLFLSEGSTHADLVAMAQDDLLVNRPDDLLTSQTLHYPKGYCTTKLISYGILVWYEDRLQKTSSYLDPVNVA